MKTHVVVIPVADPIELKETMRRIRSWLNLYTVQRAWTYNIPLIDDRYDIHVSFGSEYGDTAMLFKLACV